MKIPNITERQIVVPGNGYATEPAWLFLDGLNKWLRASGVVMYGTHAQRTAPATRGFVPAATVPDGSLFFETDTGAVYQFSDSAWAYRSGTYSRTQSQLAALAATLGAPDTGLLVNVTDFAHVLQWTGSGWQWGPGEAGSGMMVLFEVDPTGAGWHLYDGTANVKYLKSNGTTGTVTLPDLTTAPANAAYPKAGSPNGGPNAAVAPGFTGGAIAAASTGITATTSATATTQAETATGVSSVPTAGHVHAVNITDPQHTHTFSGGAVDATGEPANLVRRPWFRQ